MSQTVIEIFSDPICPWCMIGKRRLERALELLPGATGRQPPKIVWRTFQLNPTMPDEGMDRSAYLAAKFGDARRAHAFYDFILREGRSEGILFAFNRIARTPNTLTAHGLVRLAQDAGLASNVMELLFRAYFLEGLDIGQDSVIRTVAERAGLNSHRVEAYLAGDRDAATLRAEDDQARASGIGGVPHFIVDGKYSVSGAAAPKVLIRAIELAEAS